MRMNTLESWLRRICQSKTLEKKNCREDLRAKSNKQLMDAKRYEGRKSGSKRNRWDGESCEDNPGAGGGTFTSSFGKN